MSAVPVATVEILNDLLDAELNSLFRYMGDGSPYLSRATAEVRAPLARMVAGNKKRANEIYNLIESLGGSPIPRGLQPEEQYLAYLSLKFLLPRLVHAKHLCVQRYENAIAGVESAPEDSQPVLQTLRAHLAEEKGELELLERVVAKAAEKLKTERKNPV